MSCNGADTEAVRRILVVDDDGYVAEFFEACFPEARFDVRVADDAESGRAAVQAGDYDVLFLDVYLPGADGLEMLEEVKRAVDLGKVVVITGELTSGIRRRVAALGIEHCLAKPFDLGAIRGIVGMGSADRGPEPGGGGMAE
jgi:DNA-binding response OmpR family regulator